MTELNPSEPDSWCGLDFSVQRELLAVALRARFDGVEGVTDVRIEPGPVGREFDMVALLETDVGRLRTPLWSHARATIFCDPSVHPENRRQLGPERAVAEAADRLHRRIAVPYTLESRGLTITIQLEEGVERTWTAEHSLFRKRTAVVREDRVQRAGDLDVRDLLAHFYTGPALRLVSGEGAPMLLPGATEAEGPMISICHGCRRWSDGACEACPDCGGASIDVIIAARTREG